MPDLSTLKRARRDAREGKSASTQAGEFVREQIRHFRQGVHGARSTQQAIAIGLSEARRAGVDLAPPSGGSLRIQKQAARDLAKGRKPRSKPARTRQRATLRALRQEGTAAASTRALSAQARSAARRRGPQARSAAARRAAQTRQRSRA
jgi:hypothetical protein